VVKGAQVVFEIIDNYR